MKDKLPFGLALEAMKRGEKVARSAWDKDMPGAFMHINDDKIKAFASDGTISVDAPMADIKVENILAEDWYIVE